MSAFPSMVLNNFAGRWVISPQLRQIVLSPLCPSFNLWLNPVQHPEGCLVFVKAMKPASAAI
jgi:hypothetical protein